MRKGLLTKCNFWTHRIVWNVSCTPDRISEVHSFPMTAAPSRGIHVQIMRFISLGRQPCSVSPVLPQITLENFVKYKKLFGSNRGQGYRHIDLASEVRGLRPLFFSSTALYTCVRECEGGNNSQCLSYVFLASLPPCLMKHCPKDFYVDWRKRMLTQKGNLTVFISMFLMS